MMIAESFNLHHIGIFYYDFYADTVYGCVIPYKIFQKFFTLVSVKWTHTPSPVFIGTEFKISSKDNRIIAKIRRVRWVK